MTEFQVHYLSLQQENKILESFKVYLEPYFESKSRDVEYGPDRINLSPTQGVLKLYNVANVRGTGFTMYKNWEISIDLKLKHNYSNKYRNVFQFNPIIDVAQVPGAASTSFQ